MAAVAFPLASFSVEWMVTAHSTAKFIQLFLDGFWNPISLCAGLKNLAQWAAQVQVELDGAVIEKIGVGSAKMRSYLCFPIARPVEIKFKGLISKIR